MRSISELERALIEGVAQRLPSADSERLLDDLKLASVDGSSPDATRLSFTIEGYSHPLYEGQHQYPVEIRMRDVDGADITVILYADVNDRLYELELIRWDGGEVLCPNIESISFY